MLAILDPELRHSTPSRAQSATLIGTLALISIVVGAAVPAPASARPTATRNPSRDTREAKHLAAAPVSDESANVANDRPQEKPLERVVERTRTSTEAHTSRTTSQGRSSTQVEQKAEGVLERVLGPAIEAVPGIVQRVAPQAIETGTNAATVALQNWIKQGPQVGKQGVDERPALLAKVLRSDSSAQLRRVAAWGLSEYGEDNVAVEALANAVRRDASESVREMAAWSLSESDRSALAIDALTAALHDASVSVRRTAAWSLGNIGDRRAETALVAALADANADVRARAVWALGNVEPREAPRQLVAMLNDKDPHVRELTAWALYTIEDPSSAPALQAALRTEQDKDLQLGYIRALAAMGDKSVDAIRPLLESSDPRIKSMAVRALAGGHATGPWPHPWPQPRPFP
jgi:HEAT repeat protein